MIGFIVFVIVVAVAITLTCLPQWRPFVVVEFEDGTERVYGSRVAYAIRQYQPARWSYDVEIQVERRR